MSEKTKSAAIATGGIHTAAQFANLMSAVMSDLLDGSITPEVGNVVCKAAKNLLDVVEMSHRHGNGNFANVFVVPAKPTPTLASASNGNGDAAGKVKCNQCEERISPRSLAEHKRLTHSVS